jgi:hypothetical protein
LSDTIIEHTIICSNMDDDQVRALTAQGQCSQLIEYQCINAPLKYVDVDVSHTHASIFSLGKHTWFETAAGKRVSSIGRIKDKCQCSENNMCKGRYKIQYTHTHTHTPNTDNAHCNCDARAQARVSDVGWLHGDDAGITRVYALQHKQQALGEVTVGKLYCNGSGMLL